MKKTDYKPEQRIFSIYAADKKGLIGQIMFFFNRKSYDVNSINVARTDISDLVLITIEASVPEAELHPFCERLKRIIKVYTVNVIPAIDGLKKIGFYRLAIAVLDKAFWTILQKYGANMSSLSTDTLVSAKPGANATRKNFMISWKGRIYLAFAKAR